MEEILHHLRFIKNLVNSGVNYLSTGAGFLPSTVAFTCFHDVQAALCMLVFLLNL